MSVSREWRVAVAIATILTTAFGSFVSWGFAPVMFIVFLALFGIMCGAEIE